MVLVFFLLWWIGLVFFSALAVLVFVARFFFFGMTVSLGENRDNDLRKVFWGVRKIPNKDSIFEKILVNSFVKTSNQRNLFQCRTGRKTISSPILKGKGVNLVNFLQHGETNLAFSHWIRFSKNFFFSTMMGTFIAWSSWTRIIPNFSCTNIFLYAYSLLPVLKIPLSHYLQ